MSISNYRAHGIGLVVGIILGVGGASFLSSDGDGRGLADEGCVHITTSATACGASAESVCESTESTRMVAIFKGSATATESLQDVECGKV